MHRFRALRCAWPTGVATRRAIGTTSLERTVGFPLPVTWLAAWVRGAPHADAPHSVEVDATGRASVLRQNGWEIVYAYADETSRDSPRGFGSPIPTMDIAIVVDRWRR